jgi:hypothetical protein
MPGKPTPAEWRELINGCDIEGVTRMLMAHDPVVELHEIVLSRKAAPETRVAMARLLEGFYADPPLKRAQLAEELASRFFALMIFQGDGLLQLGPGAGQG